MDIKANIFLCIIDYDFKTVILKLRPTVILKKKNKRTLMDGYIEVYEKEISLILAIKTPVPE